MPETELEPRSLGELVRQFLRFQEEIRDDLGEIKVAMRDAVQKDVYEAEKALLNERISNLENLRKEDRARADRATQLALGGLVFPIVTMVIAAALIAAFVTRTPG